MERLEIFQDGIACSTGIDMSQMDALGVDVETVPSDVSVVPEALLRRQHVPTVPQTPRTVAPLITRASSRRDTDDGRVGESGRIGRTSMMSLESFLATGRAVASDGTISSGRNNRWETTGQRQTTSPPPRVAPREDRAGAVDSSVADDELEDDDEGFGYPLGLVKLVDVYTFRMSQTVTTWSTNLRKMTATQPLREAEDGTLWTASDVEFFRLLNEQLEVATDADNSSYPLRRWYFPRRCWILPPNSTNVWAVMRLPTPRLRPLGYRLSRHRRISGGRRQSRVALRKDATRLPSPLKAVEYNVLLAGVNDATRSHKLASEIEASLSEALGSADIMRKPRRRWSPPRWGG